MVLTNGDLSRLVDTNDEWIAARTGIRERRVLSDGETLTQLAADACRQARRGRGVLHRTCSALQAHVCALTRAAFPPARLVTRRLTWRASPRRTST